jgi:hypothetical protein
VTNVYTVTTIIDKSAPDCNIVMLKENNHLDEVEARSATKAEKNYSCMGYGSSFSAKAQTMSTSFLLCTSAGTLTGLSEDTSVPAAVKRQLCTGTPKSTSTVIMRQ